MNATPPNQTKIAVFIVMQMLASTLLYGQLAESGVNNSESPWTVGVSLSPDYAYRTLEQVEEDAYSSTIIETRNGNEIAKLGYTTGLSLGYRITKTIGIETGVLYSNKGFRTDELELVFGDGRIGTGGIDGIPQDLPSTAIVTSNYHYIDIPLKINAFVGNGKIKVVAGVGAVANFLVDDDLKIELTYADNSEFQYSEGFTRPENFNLSLLASLGIDYSIADRISLRCEPTFRYGMLPLYENTPITAYLWNAGINFGCYFQL